MLSEAQSSDIPPHCRVVGTAQTCREWGARYLSDWAIAVERLDGDSLAKSTLRRGKAKVGALWKSLMETAA